MANEAVETQTQNKSRAEQTMAKLESQIAEWTDKWSTALEEIGLRSNLSIESAAVVLDIMNSLDGAKIQIDNLSHRIKTMTEDREAFRKSDRCLEASPI